MRTLARAVFGLTGIVSLVGILLGLWQGYSAGLPAQPGMSTAVAYGPGMSGLLVQLCFFTTWSNAILAVTSLGLCLRPGDRTERFRVLRLAGLGMMVITYLVTSGVLEPDQAPIVQFHGLAWLLNLLLHRLAPWLAIVGWALFGPSYAVTVGRALLSALVPVGYVAFTLARGAYSDWYPYPMLDVPHHGYALVLMTCLTIALAYLVIVFVLALLDIGLRRLPIRMTEEG